MRSVDRALQGLFFRGRVGYARHSHRVQLRPGSHREGCETFRCQAADDFVCGLGKLFNCHTDFSDQCAPTSSGHFSCDDPKYPPPRGFNCKIVFQCNEPWPFADPPQ